MKKILILFVTLLTLTACTSTNVTLENPKELFSINGKSYDESVILNQILEVDYGQFLIQHLEDIVIADVMDDYEDELIIDEAYQEFLDYAEVMNISLEDLINYYGFEDVDSFKAHLKKSVAIDLFVEDKVEENLETLQKKYKIIALDAYKVDSEETAKQMVRYVESDYEMENFEKEFDLEGVQAVFYHENLEGLSEDLQSQLASISQDKITYEAVSDDQYMVYLYRDEDIDEVKLKDFIIKETDYAQTLMIGLIQDKNLKIYNNTLKKNMSIDFSDYIK